MLRTGDGGGQLIVAAADQDFVVMLGLFCRLVRVTLCRESSALGFAHTSLNLPGLMLVSCTIDGRSLLIISSFGSAWLLFASFRLCHRLFTFPWCTWLLCRLLEAEVLLLCRNGLRLISLLGHMIASLGASSYH